MTTCISAKVLAEALGISEQKAKDLLDKACSLALPATILTPDLQNALKILCSCQTTKIAEALLEFFRNLLAEEQAPKRKRTRKPRARTRKKKPTKKRKTIKTTSRKRGKKQ